MDPVLVLFGALVAFFALLYVARGRWHPRAGRQMVGESLDYGAMAEIEEHDIDQMLDGINERRRRAGRRDIGEELADELERSTWE